MHNLRTAEQVRCPTCERVTPTTPDADDQVVCRHCGENVGWMFGKAWETSFDTFYDGSIPPCFQVRGGS